MEVILHDDLQLPRKFKWFCFDIFVTCNKAAHFLPGKLACVELMTFRIVVQVLLDITLLLYLMEGVFFGQ